jgi:ribonucleotide monophosphatase NagD (HAD superfamily)
LARQYAALGGEVRLMGKPDPIIYKAALAALGMEGREQEVRWGHILP